ncbi:uncharacterized protein LOC125616851 [Marmota marmota marmota]|uniref:uncharacterized protein LOC125616851 n=1 Tax=Marmota marmota marmota TaxID=9994 RepID=UPI002092FEAD|nr:uncharacterized protein LOC125616851 [Marmota marmota marmota]
MGSCWDTGHRGAPAPVSGRREEDWRNDPWWLCTLYWWYDLAAIMSTLWTPPCPVGIPHPYGQDSSDRTVQQKTQDRLRRRAQHSQGHCPLLSEQGTLDSPWDWTLQTQQPAGPAVRQRSNLPSPALLQLELGTSATGSQEGPSRPARGGMVRHSRALGRGASGAGLQVLAGLCWVTCPRAVTAQVPSSFNNVYIHTLFSLVLGMEPRAWHKPRKCFAAGQKLLWASLPLEGPPPPLALGAQRCWDCVVSHTYQFPSGSRVSAHPGPLTLPLPGLPPPRVRLHATHPVLPWLPRGERPWCLLRTREHREFVPIGRLPARLTYRALQ